MSAIQVRGPSSAVLPVLWLGSGIATCLLGLQRLDVTPITLSRPTALDRVASGLDAWLVLAATQPCPW